MLSTTESGQVILDAFAGIDPEGRYLSLQECALRAEVDARQVMSDQAVRDSAVRVERAAPIQAAPASIEVLAGLVETVGELVATHATLHRVAERLAEVDLVETVARMVRQADGEWEQIGSEAQSSLEAWTEDLHTLGRVETEIGAALGQLQEMALTLRVKPVAEILDPLPGLVQDVAHHQAKMVELNVTGADIELDYSLLDILARPVRRLVWFAVAQGIEEPSQRREAGKPATGQVSVVVSKAEDCVQIIVEDDGCGLNHETILRQARELGWTNGNSISVDQLSQWVVRDGFGTVGGDNSSEGIDLTAINAILQTRQGWLNITSKPEQGTQFTLELPLDMAVIDGMVVRAGGVCYVVPIRAVRRIIKPEQNQIVNASADNGQNLLRLGEELVPIQTLGTGARETSDFQESLMLVVEKNERAMALPVDELIGQQQVLVRPLQGYLADDVQSVSGYALLGDGEVGMALNLNRMNA